VVQANAERIETVLRPGLLGGSDQHKNYSADADKAGSVRFPCQYPAQLFGMKRLARGRSVTRRAMCPMLVTSVVMALSLKA